LLTAAVATFAAAAVLFLLPASIEPSAWTPTPVIEATVQPEPFAHAERLWTDLDGPASIARGPAGFLITGVADGRLIRVDPVTGRQQPAGLSKGRPFGITAGLGQVTIAAAGDAGLVAVRKAQFMPLASEASGRAIRHAGDVAVSFGRGRIYFTDASDRHNPAESWAEFVEHAPRGRLLAHDVNRMTTEVLADNLHFPFGLALADDESFLLICEMTNYRVLRHWLSGDRAGTTEAFVEGLPGYPADIGPDGSGGYWLSLYAPRIESLDRLAGAPWLRALWFKLPRRLQPRPQHRAWLLHLDAAGRITRDLRDDSIDAYAPILGVLEHEGALYLGSPTQKGVLRMPLAR
jgi:sugar lactone lactonase YvrE